MENVKDVQEQLDNKNRTIKTMVGDLNELRHDLKGMLSWSQRIGSDEKHHLYELIALVNRSLAKARK
jgi:uncharacterized protein YoxC